VFRDSRGVVHTVSSTDPLRDLPGDTAAALARALLRPVDGDLDSALERCEAVRELVERWQDAFFASLPDEVDLAEEARWAAEAGLSLSDVEDQYEGDDELDGDDELEQEVALDAIDLRDLSDPVGLLDPDEVDSDPDDPRAVLPEDLVSLLERELLLLPVRVRLEALVAAADLVEGWSDLLADHEKLLGHLVLAHDEQQEPHSHTRLADRHAQLHAAQGPGHADQDD
jgi:hypothetical protein